MLFCNIQELKMIICLTQLPRLLYFKSLSVEENSIFEKEIKEIICQLTSFMWGSANSALAHSAASVSIQNITFLGLLPAVEQLFIALHFVLLV